MIEPNLLYIGICFEAPLPRESFSNITLHPNLAMNALFIEMESRRPKPPQDLGQQTASQAT